MKNNSKRTDLNKIKREIVEKCRPILERLIDELSSTTFYDAAEKAKSYYNGKLSTKFKEAGDLRREEEKNTEYEYNVEIIEGGFEFNGRKFYVCKYIPTNIKVLIYNNQKDQYAIARIKNDRLVNIKDLSILSDIAHMFPQGKAVTGDAVKSIHKALKTDRLMAKTAIEKINRLADSNLSWRYLFGEKTITKSKSTVDKYIFIEWGRIKDHDLYYSIALWDNPEQTAYKRYYVNISYEGKTYAFRLVTDLEIAKAESNSQPGPAWAASVKQGELDENIFQQPKKSDGNIANVYNLFFNLLDEQTSKQLIIAINRPVEGNKLTWNVLKTAYEAAYPTINSLKKAIVKAKEEDEEDETDPDFMDIDQ